MNVFSLCSAIYFSLRQAGRLLFFLAVLALSAQAQTESAPVQSATIPASRNDWITRSNLNNDAARKRAGEIALVFDGDSITRGWQGGGGHVWNERYAKFGAVNFGISGDRTQNVLWRVNNGQMDGLNPKLIVLMIGTNNSLRDSEDAIASGVAAIVAEYRKRCPDAVILLQAIFPRGAKAEDPIRGKLRAVNARIAKLADGDKVLFIDFGDKFLEPDGSISAEVMPDSLHLSAKGYRIWADAIQPVMDRFFPNPPAIVAPDSAKR